MAFPSPVSAVSLSPVLSHASILVESPGGVPGGHYGQVKLTSALSIQVQENRTAGSST